MISDERIERAAKAIFRGLIWRGYSEAVIKNRWHEDDDNRNEALYHARAALTADAPEIAAAEIRGLEMAEPVIEAARCIRHWHDRANGGMVVSGDHVRALWERLDEFDARIAELKAKTEPTK